MSELQKVIDGLRGKCAYTISLGKDKAPKSVSIAIKKGQMNIYEGSGKGLSVTFDRLHGMTAQEVLDMLGIEVNE